LPSSPQPNAPAEHNPKVSMARVLRAMRGIDGAQHNSFLNSALDCWKRDTWSFWRSQAKSIFDENKGEGIECIRNVYNGLHRVEQDGYVNGARHRFLLVILRYLRDRASITSAFDGVRIRGRSDKSHATDLLACTISKTKDRRSPEFKSTRQRLLTFLKAANKYISTTQILGPGILFLLGGMDACCL